MSLRGACSSDEATSNLEGIASGEEQAQAPSQRHIEHYNH